MDQWGILPKNVWQKSGYRIVTAAGATGSNGLADGASIPATTKPTMAYVDIPAKQHVRTFDMGTIQMNLSGKDDVVTFEELKAETEKEFVDCFGRALLMDANTLAGNDFESIDRIIGSYSEAAGSGYTTGDHDIWSNDRDAANAPFDAYVDHGSTTDRYFNPSQVDTVLSNIMPYWEDPASVANKVIVTGRDTFMRWNQMLTAKVRFGETRFQTSVNGIKTANGVEAGAPVSTYQGIPLICDSRTPQDTLSRILIEDLDNLQFHMLTPTLYAEAGNDLSEQLMLGKLTKTGVFALQGEVVCTKFLSQGKVRDLK
jgi:hypothetical protein